MHHPSRPHRRAPAPIVDPLEPRTFLAATRIMPLGDSITEAFTGHAGYRYWLWQDLHRAGYEVDFIGSMHGVKDGPPLYPDFDQDHEGHAGYLADQVQANAFAWATRNRPDIVLLHIGTNDVTAGQPNSSTVSEIAGIIDNLRAVNPSVTILLAQIIPNAPAPAAAQQLDALLPTLAGQKSTPQSQIILVDQWTGFDASADTYDGIHPNESGEQKMATRWYNALTAVLPAPPPPAGDTIYLSNLNWMSMSNGWGPAERDHSNGEAGASDGAAITLNGIAYSKGLGVHAASEITFNLSPPAAARLRASALEPAAGHPSLAVPFKTGHRLFQADIGIDDEVGGNGSVSFQVWLDGAQAYDSGTMTGSSPTRSISLDLSGTSTLRLVVTDAGDGIDFDHADWANARLTTIAPLPPPPASRSLMRLAAADAPADERWVAVLP